MTFSLRELSRRGGKPVAFFRFDRGALSWCLTSADREQELGGKTYAPAAIKRSRIVSGMERRKLGITVTMPRDLKAADGTFIPNPVLANWWPYPPRDRIKLTIMVRHHGDDEPVVEWIGRALTPKLGAATVELPCEPTTTTARSAAYSRCYQRGCPLAHYSTGLGMCNVLKEDHAFPLTVTTVSGHTLTSAVFGTLTGGLSFAGGFIEWTRDDGLIEQRSIVSHAGTSVGIDYGGADLVDGLEVIAYPGCKHNTEDCERYDNAENYGGDPYSPNTSLFGGQPIW